VIRIPHPGPLLSSRERRYIPQTEGKPLAQKSGEAVDGEEAVYYEVTSMPESSERAADGESAKVSLCAFFRGRMA
jgi:hypothetical protein